MIRSIQKHRTKRFIIVALAVLLAGITMAPFPARANAPEPVVAIHVSELTQALETMPAAATTPSGPGTTGKEWWTTEWHYFVGHESLKEALRSDGTPFIEVSDADIASGKLLNPDGSPKYPIVISLAAEAVDDSEVAPLRDYVAAGGFLLAGSSAFTRNPDGTTRGDFAIASEMGVHMAHPTLQNWYLNLHFSKTAEHRLVSHVPTGTLAWRMPLSSEEIPLGTALSHGVHGSHWVFEVYASGGATVIASGDSGPLLTTKPYGAGHFIYHGAMQPLVGHTVYDPSMYAYLIYRRAIEWAFEVANLPIIRVSPLRYDYDGAYVIRHDCENNANTIRAIEASAAYDKAAGGKSDFYFCTGTLREEMADKQAVIGSLRRAVSNSGATIGSHNGGLKNPVTSLPINAFDYWHWGPDEVLDITPPGYASGKAYAEASLSSSFQDVEGWLDGLDNGRAGCGAAGNCPRIWAAPYMNSTREGSSEILESLNVSSLGTGEQKVGPFPHWGLSYETPGKRFSFVSEPTSDWYVGADIPGALEWGHTTDTMRAAVDFYYALGAPINLYGHQISSDSTLMGQYVKYCASKPRMWAANAVGIADWWRARSTVVVSPAYSITGSTVTTRATVTGAGDSETAVDVAIPSGNAVSDIQVFLNDAPADPADYRFIGSTVKVRVGASSSSAAVQYTITTTGNPVPVTTGLAPTTATAGGDGFTLTVVGSGFIPGSTVQWNGAFRSTIFVSDTQVTASIAAEDIAAAGTAQVTVFNPAPGGGVSNAQPFVISNAQTGTWTQTDWAGGGGQSLWTDATRYDSAGGIDDSVNGQISLATTSTVLFSDDFTRPPDSTDPLSPWVASMGTWTVTGGVLRGSGSPWQYSYASLASAPQWTNYTLQGRIQIPAGSFGGGIGGRVDAATGAHYGAWVYPAGSPGGSNQLKLWKFRSWTDIGAGVPMQQVSLPDVGTSWHTLQLTFLGTRILVYYDGVLKIDYTDNNYDSRAPYASGGISADWWTGTGSLPYTVTVDDISVVTLPSYGNSGVLLSSAFDGGAGVQWQTLSWDAATGGSTNACVRTRTADLAEQLNTAIWSNCALSSGSAVMSAQRRWIQYQLELSTSDPAVSPIFSEIRISYGLTSPEAPVPVTTGLSPTSATAGGAAFTLTVNGTGFVADSVVQWNGGSRLTTFVTSTRLTASIPAADIVSAGTATVTVFTPAPGGGTSNSQTFTINAATNPVPTTTGLSPASATAGGAGFTLSINGTGFVSSSIVQWNGSSRTTAYISSTQLTASIPASDIATAGTAAVTVFTSAPGGGTSNARTFAINDPPVPIISSLIPSSQTAGGAAFLLTVTGQNFAADSVVRWNGANRTTIYASSTVLSAEVLASDIAIAGTAQVTVFTPAPGGGTSNARTFTINPASNPVPTTTGLNPSSATAGGSAFTLTVTGNNFISGSTVQWNGANRTTTYISSTQLTAAILAADIASAGTAAVAVFNAAPGGGTSNAQTLTINAANNPVPTTSGLSPASATAGGAAFTLTVNGSNFINGSVVRWNGVDRATTYVSSTQVTASIYSADISAAGTAQVTVFTPAPGGGTSNNQTFTINAPSTALFSDDFTRTSGGTLSPWVTSMGTWTVTGGVMMGTGSANQYSYASISPTSQWTDYTLQGRIQIPAGSFGGGIGGRVDAATGAHYGAWVYPAGSPGGSNLLKLWKFRGWTDIGAGVPMQQVSLPTVGTGWHTLQMTFLGNRIFVYYDGVLKIDYTDNNYDSRAAYLSGGISVDWWTWSPPYTITVDDISVAAQ